MMVFSDQKKRMKISCVLRLMILTVIALMAPSTAFAQDEEMGEEAAIYIPIKPPFVVNYGGVGRLRYLKAEVTVRVQDSLAADSIRHHLPLIRNDLVLLFSKQTEEDIETQIGKENLRAAALEAVRDILIDEDDQEGVVDLYFENFVVQR